jgi:hypothetical protein
MSVLESPSPPRLSILMVLPVENSKRCSELMNRNFERISTFTDQFQIALLHFDGEGDHFDDFKWVQDPNIVVMRSRLVGTKIFQWKQITPLLCNKYDYIWFLDTDLGVEQLEWNLIRTALIQRKPLYCQPSVLGYQNGRSTDVSCLRHDPHTVESNSLTPYAHPRRSEVQTPILDARMYPIVYEYIKLMDNLSDWGVDTYWDSICMQCSRPMLLVYTPLVHYDFNNVKKNGAVRRLIKNYRKDVVNYDQMISELKKTIAGDINMNSKQKITEKFANVEVYFDDDSDEEEDEKDEQVVEGKDTGSCHKRRADDDEQLDDKSNVKRTKTVDDTSTCSSQSDM